MEREFDLLMDKYDAQVMQEVKDDGKEGNKLHELMVRLEQTESQKKVL